jgi:DNA repair protein RecO (recombination protein O)
MKAHQVPCFILHRRPFRETSLILDVVALDYGRLNVVLRGARGGKKTAVSALAQVFRPLLLSFSGNGELKNVISIEENGPAVRLEDKYLYSGFYINELICRLWPQNVDSDGLYASYVQTVAELVESQNSDDAGQPILEPILRRFEFNLLDLLGYGIDCFYTSDNNDAIAADKHYLFVSGQGFILADPDEGYPVNQPIFAGDALLAIGDMRLSAPKVLKTAKQLIRFALSPHLGHKPLKSRELFINLQT